MLKCDSTSSINKLWKTLNYFRQLINAYKMAAPITISLCMCVCGWVCVSVVVLIYSCTFLKRTPSSGTAVAVKQFISLMHFVATKSNGRQPGIDLIDPTLTWTQPDPPRPNPLWHKMAQRKRFSMKFMTHGNIRRSLTFTTSRRVSPLHPSMYFCLSVHKEESRSGSVHRFGLC